MTTINSKGKQSTNSQSGGLRFEQDNDRIIGRASDGKPNIILSSKPNEQAIFEVAQNGYDVTTCTDDQKVMSSKFNMWKIIYEGKCNGVSPRNSNITLSGNNIGYQFYITIDVMNDVTKAFSDGFFLVNICGLVNKVPIRGSGTFYDDGTNKVIYKYESGCLFNSGSIYISYSYRIVYGSFTFNPFTDFYMPVRQSFYWQIANTTQKFRGGQGGTGSGSGKYCYYDTISLNSDGTTSIPLNSFIAEFIGDTWKYFPG